MAVVVGLEPDGEVVGLHLHDGVKDFRVAHQVGVGGGEVGTRRGAGDAVLVVAQGDEAIGAIGLELHVQTRERGVGKVVGEGRAVFELVEVLFQGSIAGKGIGLAGGHAGDLV